MNQQAQFILYLPILLKIGKTLLLFDALYYKMICQLILTKLSFIYNIQIYIIDMRSHRNKFDIARPFTLVHNKLDFEELTATDQIFAKEINNHDKESLHPIKQKTAGPKMKVVERANSVKSFAKITPNYIRIPEHLTLPNGNDYQLTQIDLVFIKTHKDKYKHGNQSVLTQDFLIKLIIELETKAGKDNVLPRSKGWVDKFMQREYKQLISVLGEKYQNFTTLLYNFWRNQRQMYQFPLYRPLWRPAHNQTDHTQAFRPRIKQTRNLRRSIKESDLDVVHEELVEQFDNASLLCDRIQMREELKLKNIQLQMAAFYSEAKCFVSIDSVDFSEFYSQESRTNDRQRLKRMHQTFDQFKRNRQNVQKDIDCFELPMVVDQKQSVVNFLSTVINEAELLGINYQHFFPPNFNNGERSMPNKTNFQYQIQQNLPIISNSEDQNVNTALVENKKIQSDELLYFSLERTQDLLIKSFSQDEDEQNKPTTSNYLDMNRKRVSCYYFGDNDQVEENIKRGIATSFKRFLQLSPSTLQNSNSQKYK